MLNDNLHIAVIHHERVPTSLLDEFCASVNTDSLSFERISRPEPGPQMGMEWLAIPAIAVFLLKPYFESFMTEAGRDHYHVLRNALKALWDKLFSKNRRFRVAVVTVSGEKTSKYSMLFAIYANVDNNQLVKLLVRQDCSEDEYAASVDAFLKFLESRHAQKPAEKQASELDHQNEVGGITLVEYDGKSESLRIVNPQFDPRDRQNDDV